MKRLATAALIGVIGLVAAGSPLLAHEETYTGTVAAVEAAKVQVKVVDQKSKKETTMDFGVNAKTKILRGDKTVSLSEARIQKDERIAVTIDHDVPGHNATMIRLAASKE